VTSRYPQFSIHSSLRLIITLDSKGSLNFTTVSKTDYNERQHDLTADGSYSGFDSSSGVREMTRVVCAAFRASWVDIPSWSLSEEGENETLTNIMKLLMPSIKLILEAVRDCTRLTIEAGSWCWRYETGKSCLMCI
jgi:hypothetical protein